MFQGFLNLVVPLTQVLQLTQVLLQSSKAQERDQRHNSMQIPWVHLLNRPDQDCIGQLTGMLRLMRR